MCIRDRGCKVNLHDFTYKKLEHIVNNCCCVWWLYVSSCDYTKEMCIRDRPCTDGGYSLLEWIFTHSKDILNKISWPELCSGFGHSHAWCPCIIVHKVENVKSTWLKPCGELLSKLVF